MRSQSLKFHLKDFLLIFSNSWILHRFSSIFLCNFQYGAHWPGFSRHPNWSSSSSRSKSREIFAFASARKVAKKQVNGQLMMYWNVASLKKPCNTSGHLKINLSSRYIMLAWTRDKCYSSTHSRERTSLWSLLALACRLLNSHNFSCGSCTSTVHNNCWPEKSGSFSGRRQSVSTHQQREKQAKWHRKQTPPSKNKAKPQYASSHGLNVDLENLHLSMPVLPWKARSIVKVAKNAETQHCGKGPCPSLILSLRIANVKNTLQRT